MEVMDILAVIMASGLSKRMGENKLLLNFKGKPLVEWVILTVKNIGFSETILVYKDLDVKNIGEKYNIKTVYNKNNYLGQSSAIKVSLKNSVLDNEGYMFFTGDQPLISEEIINRLLEEFNKKNGIIVPRINGSNSSPVIFSKEFKGELMNLNGDVGGKGIITNNIEKVTFVDFNSNLEFCDIDTKEDFKKLDI